MSMYLLNYKNKNSIQQLEVMLLFLVFLFYAVIGTVINILL